MNYRSVAVNARCYYNCSYECSVDARLRCSMVDLYYALFGTRKPVCLLDEDQQMLADMSATEPPSRRKSPLTTREGIEEFKRVCEIAFLFCRMVCYVSVIRMELRRLSIFFCRSW